MIVVPSDVEPPTAADTDQPHRISQAIISSDEFAGIVERLVSAARSLKDAESFGAYFDSRRGTFVIQGTAPPELFDTVGADYENDAVVYERVESGGRESRQSDSPPFWGGAAVEDGYGTCSTGFTVKRPNGTRYLMTAGHCFGLTYGVWSPGNNNWMGTIDVRASFPAHDMEMIGGENYGRHIYTGGATGTGTAVQSAANPVIGAFYCVSGQRTYEHCDHELISNQSYFCDIDGCTNNVSAYWGDPINITMNGDSGAPWYIKSSGVHIRGLHIAREGVVMYAQKWSTVSSVMNVTIYAP